MKAKLGNQGHGAWEDTVETRLSDGIQVWEELLSWRGRRPSPRRVIRKEPCQLLGKKSRLEDMEEWH